MTPAPEGSVERRWARYTLMKRAHAARIAGYSYYTWVDSEEQCLLDAVSQRDMDAIFALTWRPNKRGKSK